MLLRCIIGSIGHFVFFGVMVVLIIPGYFIYLISKLFVDEPKYVFQWGANLCYKIFYFLVPRITLKKELLDDYPKSAVYVSTHQSILDFPALATFIKKYIIFANVNLGKFPTIAKITNLAGVRYIKGKTIDQMADIYKELESHLDEDKNVIYFPEGTRHEADKLLQFKRGAFRLAMKKNKPVIPIVIEGAQNILPKKTFCFKTTKKVTVYLKMLPPLYPKDFNDEIEMMKYAYEIMQKTKNELSQLS